MDHRYDLTYNLENIIYNELISRVKWLCFNDFKKLFFSRNFVTFSDDYRNLVLKLLEDNFE